MYVCADTDFGGLGISDDGSMSGIRTVDGIVHPFVHLVNLCAEPLGININCSLVLGQLVVKHSVKHPDNLGTLVVHDRLCLLVPEHRHSEPDRREGFGN